MRTEKIVFNTRNECLVQDGNMDDDDDDDDDNDDGNNKVLGMNKEPFWSQNLNCIDELNCIYLTDQWPHNTSLKV